MIRKHLVILIRAKVNQCFSYEISCTAHFIKPYLDPVNL